MPPSRSASSRWCAGASAKASAAQTGPSGREASLSKLSFALPGSTAEVEEGRTLAPKFDADALARTIETGEAWYFSRSRQTLWRKGETSGHVQRVTEMRIDCDQDAVWIKVEQAGAGACHTGRRSCFYRAVPLGGSAAAAVLEFRDGEKRFDPGAVYGDQEK